jgi:hypothetical protein
VDGFLDMSRADRFGAVEIGNRACKLKNPVVGSCPQAQAVYPALSSIRSHSAESAQYLRIWRGLICTLKEIFSP